MELVKPISTGTVISSYSKVLVLHQSQNITNLARPANIPVQVAVAN